ncbi:hypothetical protein LED50_20710 [Salmonella enterica]|nr:hypothetical protein [Salmonella enterica]
MAVPAPVPVPGVPVGPGDKVKQDADKKIASGIQGVIDDATDWLDKTTQCSFGRVCSSDGTKQTDGPNVGKNLTDTEKVELGGAGSGTPGGWEPEDEENARNSGNSKPSQNGSNFTESEITGSIGGTAAGAWAGGLFGEYAPGIVNSVTGKEFPGFIFDATGAFGSEFLGGYIKDVSNNNRLPSNEKKEEGK